MAEVVEEAGVRKKKPLIVGLFGLPGAGKTTLFKGPEHVEISKPIFTNPKNPFYVGKDVSHEQIDEKIREVGNGDIHQGYSELLRIQLPEIMKKIKKHNMVILDAIRSKEQLKLLEQQLKEKYGEDGYHLALVEVKAPYEQRLFRFIRRSEKNGESQEKKILQHDEKEKRDKELLYDLPDPKLVVHHIEESFIAAARRKGLNVKLGKPYLKRLQKNMRRILSELHQILKEGTWEQRIGKKPTATCDSLDEDPLEEQSKTYPRYRYEIPGMTETKILKKQIISILGKKFVNRLSIEDYYNVLTTYLNIEDEFLAEQMEKNRVPESGEFEERFMEEIMRWVEKSRPEYMNRPSA